MDISRRRMLQSGSVLVGGTVLLTSTASQSGLAAETWNVNDITIKNGQGTISKIIIRESDLKIDLEWKGIENTDENVLFSIEVYDSESEEYLTWNGASGEINIEGQSSGNGTIGDDLSWASPPGDINLLSNESPLDSTEFKASNGNIRETDVKLRIKFEHPDVATTDSVTFTVTVHNKEIIENFEDSDMSEYSGDIGSFTTQSDIVFAGQYSVRSNIVTQSSRAITSLEGDGLNYYPERGDTFEVRSYHGGQETNGDLYFAVGNHTNGSTIDNGYRLLVSPRQDRIALFVRNDTNISTIDDKSTTIPSGEWLRWVIDWGDSGDFNINIYDSEDNLLGTVSGNNTDHDSGGIGFRYFDDSGTGAIHFDEVRTIE